MSTRRNRARMRLCESCERSPVRRVPNATLCATCAQMQRLER